MSQEEKYIADFKETILGYYPISDNAFSLFEKIMTFNLFKKNEILVYTGQIAKTIYFICDGAIIAYVTDNFGNTYNKNIFLEKQFASSRVSSILQTPSDFTLQAIEDSVVICMPYTQYKKITSENEELKQFYIVYLEKNWIIDKEQREISLVMENATTRYIKLLKAHPNIDKRIPLQHIASHLGITPTQLSRIRKDLKKNDSNQHM